MSDDQAARSGTSSTHPESDGTWGPTQEGGSSRGPVRIVLYGLLVLVLLVVGFAVATAFYASSQIERTEVAGLMQGGGPLNVLVVGSDSRAGLTEEERRELSTGSAEGERTDTIFVLQVSGGEVAMLAFPRDLYVERCDGSQGRINSAMAVGGPGCLVETVTDLSGIAIDHYLEVQFLGFRDIVDAVGGVEMCLEQPIQDDDAGIDLPAGCQVLDGQEALGYVRVRKIDNDLERIKRQQQFLGNLAEKLASPSTFVNPLRLWSTAGAIGEALRSDQDLGPTGLARLGWGLRGLAGGDAALHTVPVTPDTVGGAAVLRAQQPEADELFAAFRSGSAAGEAGADLQPSDVSVRVLNGAGIPDLAGQTSEALAAEGFDVVGIGNADIIARTTVLHPPGQEAEAQFLAARFSASAGVDPEVEPDPSVNTVTLVLGQDLGS